MVINKFDKEFHFLSNFYPCVIKWNGRKFKNAEAAYQSAKSPYPIVQDSFVNMGASESKKEGRKVVLREDWDTIKFDMMCDIVEAKFNQNDYLEEMLIATRDYDLIEGNTWGDTYWGVCDGYGMNMLGKILMALRDDINERSR